MENIELWLSIFASIISILSFFFYMQLRQEINTMKNSGSRNINSQGKGSKNNTGDNVRY